MHHVEECKKELWTVEYCDLSDKKKKKLPFFFLNEISQVVSNFTAGNICR